MLPKRKHIDSYNGMGVAVLTLGQRKAVKLKIVNTLVSYGPTGREVVGLQLHNIWKYKDRLACRDYVFKFNGLEYIKPVHVYRNCREALEYIDSERMKELGKRMDEIRGRIESNKKEKRFLQEYSADTQKKMEEAIAVRDNRPWNRKKKGKQEADNG